MQGHRQQNWAEFHCHPSCRGFHKTAPLAPLIVYHSRRAAETSMQHRCRVNQVSSIRIRIRAGLRSETLCSSEGLLEKQDAPGGCASFTGSKKELMSFSAIPATFYDTTNKDFWISSRRPGLLLCSRRVHCSRAQFLTF